MRKADEFPGYFKNIVAFDTQYFKVGTPILVQEWNPNSRAKEKKPIKEYYGIIGKFLLSDTCMVVYENINSPIMTIEHLWDVSHVLEGYVTFKRLVPEKEAK